MQIFDALQIALAALAALCFLVAGLFSVLSTLSGTGAEELVAGRGAPAPEPVPHRRRRETGRSGSSAPRARSGLGDRSVPPPLPVRRPGTVFPGQC